MNKRNGVALIIFLGVLCVVVGVVVKQIPTWSIRASFPLLGTPSSVTWRRWEAPSHPRQIAFYFFNVTNAADIGAGGIPAVEEIGPFVYKEFVFNEIVGFDEQFQRLTFKRKKEYVFDEKASEGHSEVRECKFFFGFSKTQEIRRTFFCWSCFLFYFPCEDCENKAG